MLIARTITTSAGPIEILEAGDGPPLLLLHGVPGSARAWEPVADRLAATHRVVAPNLLGFGGSAWADDLHATAQAAAIVEVADALELRAAVVVTHDFGGPVALQVFATRPDLLHGLVLSATNAFGDTPVPFPLSAIFWPIVGRVAAGALFSSPSLRLLLRTGAGQRSPHVDSGLYVGSPRQAKAIRTIFETSLRNLDSLYGPLAAILPTIDVPTAVLWGDRDPFFTIESGRRTASAIPGATFTVLEGAGHFLPAERPDAYVVAVEELRSRVSP